MKKIAPLLWDGLEPEPGVYDEASQKGIDQRIEWARQLTIRFE